MKKVFLRSIFALFCALTCLHLSAQKNKKKELGIEIEDFIPTPGISNRPRIKKKIPKIRSYRLIYVSSIKNILYGNPCAYQATHNFGFEYIVEPLNPELAQSRTQIGKVINNLWVKTGLVFRRSPFWKAILNGKFKKCQKITGDFVG